MHGKHIDKITTGTYSELMPKLLLINAVEIHGKLKTKLHLQETKGKDNKQLE